jgi:peroxiredoxin
MKTIFLAAWVIAFVLLTGQKGFSAETNDIIKGIDQVITSANIRIQQGARTENDFTNELSAFDALYAKYKKQKTEDVAEILAAKAILYLQVINDPEKAAKVLKQIKHDLPETNHGKNVNNILDALKKPIEIEKNRNALKTGVKFPNFKETDLEGKPLSISQYKGKVVLVDFWATWCPPCLRELPNTLKVYEKYHDKGFEIVGISMDDDRAQLEKFIKDQKIAWPQFFDGKGRDNKLAVKYGADAPPEFYLLDRSGKIIGMDRFPDTVGTLRGDAMDAAVAQALTKK